MCEAELTKELLKKEEHMKKSHIKKVKPTKINVAADPGTDPGGCRPAKVN